MNTLFVFSFVVAVLLSLYLVKFNNKNSPFLRGNTYADEETTLETKFQYLAVLLNQKQIWTGDDELPFAEAFVVDTETRRFIAVGTRKEIEEQFLKNPSNSNKVKVLLDADDSQDSTSAFVVPGMIDSHAHLILGGGALMGVNLRHAASKKEFVETIHNYIKDYSTPGKKEYLLQEGDWILGGAWNENNWAHEGSDLPTKEMIDEVTGSHPTYVMRMDGHSCLCNSLALKLANITKDTPEVDGGTIVRDENGEPTGILKDLAMTIVQQIVPPPNSDIALLVGMKHALKNGITTVHNMGAGPFAEFGGSWKEIETFQRARDKETLNVRVAATVELPTWKNLSTLLQTPSGAKYLNDEYLTLRTLKAFFDGSLGSATALQFEAYANQPNNFGLQVAPDEEFYEHITGLESAGLQIAVHAIGEKAIHKLINIYEKVIKESKDPGRDRRFRVEHVQQVRPEDRKRMKELGLIASMQPTHLLDDALYAKRVLGENSTGLNNLYVFRSIIDDGTVLAFGSDWFVADINPLLGIYTAVTRITDNSSQDGWNPKERITLEEALKGYTLAGAYAIFRENELGKIKNGYLADFVVLDKNIFSVQPQDLKDVRVTTTVVGGKVVYESRH